MAEKKLSMKGLADIMTASPMTLRTIIRNYKYPDSDEARASIRYYREARTTIALFHSKAKGLEWLERIATDLMGKASVETNKHRAHRLSNNGRVLLSYARHFGNRKLQVLDNLYVKVDIADLRVSVAPDLQVMEGGDLKLIKYWFSAKEPSIDEIRIMAQVMLMAADSQGLSIVPKHIEIIDVERGKVYREARKRSSLQKNIIAACRNASAIWDAM